MKKLILFLSLILFFFIGFSQQEIIVQHNNKGAYVVHTVRPKDNFYSVGRLYAISPKDIAAFNGLDMTKGLEIGQTLMIPLTPANFSQSKATGTPVYYVVGEKEGLYRVSSNNGKVLMASLRKWNHLTNDNISAGQKLIVGYLQATGAPNTTVVAKTETPTPASTSSTTTTTQPKQEDVKEAPQQTAPPKEEPKKDTRVVTSQEVKPIPTSSTTSKPAATGAGYFKSQFDQQSKEHNNGFDATVTSGIFKTTSGWQDAKYYALMDKVEPGTIVQVVNPVNNKSIYAKVLGEMSGIRQNQGLELRISNAAATALDIAEPDKFIVRVLY